jgi:DNA topoisomerase-1
LKNLIIVESPAKAKTIKNFLGKNYEVVASKGHIRDLPKSAFGIKVEDDKFTPTYRVPKENSALVKELKEKAKKADQVFIATDEDREGEAIGFHVATAIGKDPVTLPRIVFHEITKKAILHAIENPRVIDMEQVNAQQTRRLLDRIVGYKLSPLISAKIQRGLSAGRVQSSALKIVVDREREIKAFKPVEYYAISAIFDNNIETNLTEYKNQKMDKLSVNTKELADEIIANINNKNFKVEKIDKKQKTTKTPPPFMTSTLQQSASSMLGFSPKKTMTIAQSLYEGVKTDNGTSGIITYMRTDSLNIAKEAVEAVRDHIQNEYGDKYLPNKPKYYATKNQSAQEAHEAIRPVRVDFTPQVAQQYLKPDELRLYRLIYNRFLSSQMEDAKFDTQSIIISNENVKMKTNGRVLIFDGFYRVWGDKDKDKLLPALEVSQNLSLTKSQAQQKFTEPPSRFSEASLIKMLEQLGIGRPSTYAPTISILQSREYIEIEKKQIVPTEIAFKIIEVLEVYFQNIVDSEFTANMEDILDQIAQNQKDWQTTLLEFYNPFMEKIEYGKKNIKSQKVAIPIDEPCPQCGDQLVKRKGRYGEFISCNTYPKCKYTRNISKDGQQTPTQTDIKCDKCGKEMVVKTSRRGDFLACSGYPECKNAKPLQEPKKCDVPCPKCGKDILERNSKKGKIFFGCSGYPECDFISNFKPVDKKCPECNYVMASRVLRKKDIFECLNSECKHKEDA